jgi:hypothetical protein
MSATLAVLTTVLWCRSLTVEDDLEIERVSAVHLQQRPRGADFSSRDVLIVSRVGRLEVVTRADLDLFEHPYVRTGWYLNRGTSRADDAWIPWFGRLSTFRMGNTGEHRWCGGAVFPDAIIIALFGVPPVVWMIRRHSRRRAPHACRRCGYDLRATPCRCPECGAVERA